MWIIGHKNLKNNLDYQSLFELCNINNVELTYLPI